MRIAFFSFFVAFFQDFARFLAPPGSAEPFDTRGFVQSFPASEQPFAEEFCYTQLFEGLLQTLDRQAAGKPPRSEEEREACELMALAKECAALAKEHGGIESEAGMRAVRERLLPANWKLKSVTLPAMSESLPESLLDRLLLRSTTEFPRLDKECLSGEVARYEISWVCLCQTGEKKGSIKTALQPMRRSSGARLRTCDSTPISHASPPTHFESALHQLRRTAQQFGGRWAERLVGESQTRRESAPLRALIALRRRQPRRRGRQRRGLCRLGSDLLAVVRRSSQTVARSFSQTVAGSFSQTIARCFNTGHRSDRGAFSVKRAAQQPAFQKILHSHALLPTSHKRAKGELRRRVQSGQRRQHKIKGRHAPNRVVQRDQKIRFHRPHIAARKRVQRQIGEHYGSERESRRTLAAGTRAVCEFGGQMQRGGTQTLQMGG